MRKRICSISRRVYLKLNIYYSPPPPPPPTLRCLGVRKCNNSAPAPSTLEKDCQIAVGAVGFAAGIGYFIQTYNNRNHPTLVDIMDKLLEIENPEKEAPARAPASAPARAPATPVKERPLKKLPAPDRAIIFNRSPKQFSPPAGGR